MAYYTEDTPAEEPGHTPQNPGADQPFPAVLHSAPGAEDPHVAREDRNPTDVRSGNDHDAESASAPLADWGKLIGDVPAATAIVDAFLHHAEILTLKGRSYRLKDRAGKAEAATKEAATEEAVVQSEGEEETACRKNDR